MTIHNHHDFHAFSMSGRPNLLTAALRRGKSGVDKALLYLIFFAKRVRQIGEHLAQHFFAALLLKASVHGFVVRITLGKHLRLRAGVENPQHRFQDSTRRDGLATGTTIRNTFLRKVLANPLPLLFAQSQHVRNFTALHAATK
jgi:hypothetical protein